MRTILSLLAALLIASAPAAQPYKFRCKSDIAEFEYGWSAEVSSIPALVRRFRAGLREQRERIVSGGREFVRMREEMGDAPLGYTHSTNIGTAGQTSRLLSLQIDVYEFTGGAHGNGGTQALLWDRELGMEIPLGSLFAPDGGWQDPLRSAFCPALDAERRKRRGGDGKTGGTISEFDSCPPFADLSIIPSDSDGDSRFDSIRLIADPYVAGPYAEGDYEIALPLTESMVTSIRSEYRPSFEAQPQ